MNKDADERLVSSGEYRDALNIEVTTSEGSNVGTAQSVLGNIAVTDELTKLFKLPQGITTDKQNLYTVGHIVDEKDDRVIRLVARPAAENTPYSHGVWSVGIDHIMEYNTKITSPKTEVPIFTDVYYLETANAATPVCSPGTYSVTYTLPSVASPLVRVGMKIAIINKGQGTVLSGMSFNDNLVVTSKVGNVITIERENKSPWSTTVSISTNSTTGYPDIALKADRVLKFDNPNAGGGGIPTKVSITGINLLDDLLFWTDNHSEPKKIHIPR